MSQRSRLMLHEDSKVFRQPTAQSMAQRPHDTSRPDELRQPNRIWHPKDIW